MAAIGAVDFRLFLNVHGGVLEVISFEDSGFIVSIFMAKFILNGGICLVFICPLDSIFICYVESSRGLISNFR